MPAARSALSPNCSRERSASPIWEEVKANYARIRETRARTQGNRRRVSLEDARKRAFDADATGHQPVRPLRPGLTTIDDVRLADLRDYIDWTPFFLSWEMKGSYPAIFDDPNRGEAARALFDDAQAMLDKMVSKDWLRPRGVVGLWPARRKGDDIELFADETCKARIGRFFGLRQQAEKGGRKPVSVRLRFRPQRCDRLGRRVCRDVRRRGRFDRGTLQESQ